MASIAILIVEGSPGNRSFHNELCAIESYNSKPGHEEILSRIVLAMDCKWKEE